MEVAALRHKTNLSQRQFAELFDIPVRTLQQWEQGKSKPPHYVVSMMEKLLAYRPDITEHRAREKRHHIPPKTHWKVCIERPFANCARVYPLQQRKVRALLDDLASNPAVRRVVVFGSSVTESCHIGSDVDLFVELAEDVRVLSQPHDFEYDLWTNFTADARLMQEINEKGVTVYG